MKRPPYETLPGDGERSRPSIGGGAANERGDAAQPFVVPRCDHGNIILGCPDDDCEKQNAYLLEHAVSLNRFEAYQQELAAQIVRRLVRETPYSK